MPRITISNFRYGLDKRRSEIEQQPGTLDIGNNGHVNQGGEFEKRQKFTKLDGALKATGFATYGLEVTSTGMLVFGSDALPDPSPLPALVAYQRLQHPDETTAMSGVIHSTNFGGKAFVIAEFANGEVLPFYDGTLVYDFAVGKVLDYLVDNPAGIIDMLKAHINASSTNLTATDVVGQDTMLDVEGPLGVQYTLEDTVVSDHGVINSSLLATSVAEVRGTSAFAQFRVRGGSVSAGVNRIMKVEVGPSGGPFIEITNGAVDFVGDRVSTALAVVNSINTKTSTPEYTAVASQSIVKIYASAEDGATPNNYVVKVTTAGDVVIGEGALLFVSPDTPATTTVINELQVNLVNILSTTFEYDPAGGGDATTLAGYAAVIAADINANNATYNAFADGETLRISKRVTSSEDVEVAIRAIMTNGGVSDPGGGVVGVDPLYARVSGFVTGEVITHSTSGNYLVVSNVATCLPEAGSGVYTSYYWRETSPGSGNGITIDSQFSASTRFRGGVAVNNTLIGSFVCEVTDSNMDTATSVAMLVELTVTWEPYEGF